MSDVTKPGQGTTLDYWDPEDDAFWSQYGKRIATRNLWISIPNLLCGFAVWLYWSIIIVQMQNLHSLGFFPFAEDKSLLYTLPAIAGLAGATLRIPNSFMIAIAYIATRWECPLALGSRASTAPESVWARDLNRSSVASRPAAS